MRKAVLTCKSACDMVSVLGNRVIFPGADVSRGLLREQWTK